MPYNFVVHGESMNKRRLSSQDKSTDSNNTSSSEKVSYQRVVLKFGTNLLTGGTDRLDMKMMAGLASQVASLLQKGVEVLVVSSGAIAAGREALKSTGEHRDIPFRQVLAAVGQSRLMQAYEQVFAGHDVTVAQALVTKGDMSQRLGYLNVRNTLLALLELKVVPIINENDVVAVEEIGEEVFGDNDNLSAMVANLVDADLLVLLGDIDGLYTADPHKEPGAKLIRQVDRIDASIEALAGSTINERSRGGMATKIQAARLATASGVDVIIANGRAPEVITRLVLGEAIGTLFPATGSHVESRKRWMLSTLSDKDRVVVDDGAAKALTALGRSLLPAGIRKVHGDFQRGDVIGIMDSQGQVIACGITNYGARDLETIKGTNSKRILQVLGYQYGEEVVHRNNLVVY